MVGNSCRDDDRPITPLHLDALHLADMDEVDTLDHEVGNSVAFDWEQLIPHIVQPAHRHTLLQDKQFTPDVTRILRNMKAARQVEAVELMIAGNTITVAHAEALLKARQPEQRADMKPAEREKNIAPIEQIEKLEKEMSQVQEKYQEDDSNYGSDLLNQVVANG